MDKLAHKRLLILGLARQGVALARFAANVGAAVTVSDLRSAGQLTAERAELADVDFRYVLGHHPPTLLDEADLVAVSGSVPLQAPIVQAARERGIPLTNDSREFLRRCPTDSHIGITGSAGKTTTTALTGEMAARWKTTWVGGNIGRPLLHDLAEMSADDIVVQELSSFQLDIWDDSPPVAAVLNITPNHLDRHGTMAAYTAAKANILAHQTAADTAVLCADDPGAIGLASQVRGRLRTFSMKDAVADGAFVRDHTVFLRDGETETAVLDVDDIQLRGDHNIYNVLAACTLADTVGVPVAHMQTAAATFAGVAHRQEIVRELDGVLYVNDSIATAPERSLAAIRAFRDRPLILLAGGQDKKMVWDEWAHTVAQQARLVVLFGSLRPFLADVLQAAGAQQVIGADGFAAAVKVAHRHAQSGDVVLLSPGGTSYDAFKDFAERGEQFRRLVHTFQNRQLMQ